MYFTEDHHHSSNRDCRFASDLVDAASPSSPFAYPSSTPSHITPYHNTLPSSNVYNNLNSQYRSHFLGSVHSSSSPFDPASVPPLDDPATLSPSNPPSSSSSTLPLPSPLLPQSFDNPQIVDLSTWDSLSPFADEGLPKPSTDVKTAGFRIVPSPEEMRISQACKACKARKSKVISSKHPQRALSLKKRDASTETRRERTELGAKLAICAFLFFGATANYPASDARRKESNASTYLDVLEGKRTVVLPRPVYFPRLPPPSARHIVDPITTPRIHSHHLAWESLAREGGSPREAGGGKGNDPKGRRRG